MMKPGAVIVDVAVDQGGCVETIRATTHDDPVYEVDGILHYGVANMPGAVPITATAALVNHTIEYGLMVAGEGLKKAVHLCPPIARGLNTYQGYCVHASVARALDLKHTALETLL